MTLAKSHQISQQDLIYLLCAIDKIRQRLEYYLERKEYPPQQPELVEELILSSDNCLT